MINSSIHFNGIQYPESTIVVGQRSWHEKKGEFPSARKNILGLLPVLISVIALLCVSKTLACNNIHKISNHSSKTFQKLKVKYVILC